MRCPVKAVEMDGEAAKVSPDRCIGCGLCVTACAPEAITLQKRAAEPETHGTFQELGMAVLSKKGKLEEFIKVMKR